MTMKQGQPIDRMVIGVLGVLLLALMAGCQTSGSTIANRSVADGERIPILAGGPHAGTFVTRDMTIAYRYQVVNSKLLISGTTDIKYANIEKLSMTLYYLDGNGTVIDYYRFFARPQKSKRGKVMDNTFSREFDLAADAKAFSIGYTGKTRETQKKGGWVFQHSPFL